jgi:AcrR family transcriptional regulator
MAKMPRQKQQRGRPPSIDRAQIEKAVRKIRGRENVTVERVAEALGVDKTTIYRHVGGALELRRIHAIHEPGNTGAEPKSKGETWETWLAALAQYYRSTLNENPDLVDYTLIALDPNYGRLEETTRTLIDFGFEPRAAFYAHAFVTTTVVGYFQQEMHSRAEQARGRHPLQHMLSILVEDGGEQLPILQSLDWGLKDFDSDAQFERLISYLISGIAQQPGAPKRSRKGR